MHNHRNNIILIGFMGCGKTSFGKWLAKHCGMQFVDTDAYIEQSQDRLIKDIFASEGEEYFRDLETAALKSLCSSLTDTVVSAGGGLPLREENRRHLQTLGTVVYLRTSQEELAKRLSQDNTRPLLAGGHVEGKIAALLTAREPVYLSAAEWILDTDGQSFEELYGQLSKFKREKGQG